MTEYQAVAFDRAAYQAWLNAPSKDNPEVTNCAASQVLSTAWQRDGGEGGWLLEAALTDIRDLDGTLTGNRRPWAHGPGVTGVRVWAIADPEGAATGGVTGEVVVNGVPLSLGDIGEGDLVPAVHDVLPGDEAAELALTALAERVNEVAAHFRSRTQVGAGAGREQQQLANLVLAKLWFHSRNGGTPKRVRVSDEEHAAADAVLAQVQGSSVQAEAERIIREASA